MIKIISWILAILAAIIMLQTLYFKFSGASESVQLFTQIGMEPWGRIGVGLGELMASILVLIPATRFWAALLGAGLMAGAIFFHVTIIGIVDESGSPLLFIYALTTMISCAILLVIHRNSLLKYFKKK